MNTVKCPNCGNHVFSFLQYYNVGRHRRVAFSVIKWDNVINCYYKIPKVKASDFDSKPYFIYYRQDKRLFMSCCMKEFDNKYLKTEKIKINIIITSDIYEMEQCL